MKCLPNSKDKISVVIPTYNRASLLDRALQSVMAQTRPADEIIVVDDGSIDGTAMLIESTYKNSVEYLCQPNRGVSSARNTGIRKAKGNWIALLDSDDEWKADKLESQLAALEKQPEYDFCHTNEIWIRNGKRVNAMTKHEKTGGYIFDNCLPLCVISPSSVIIRKTVFDEIGLFDEELPACADYDFWLRYCCEKPVLYLDKPLLTKYGGHEDQLSKKYLGMDYFRLQSLVNLMSLTSLTMQQVSAIKNTFFEKYEILSNGAIKHKNDEMLRQIEGLFEEMQKQIAHRGLAV